MPNILIVEDDININNLLCEVLVKAGYTCEQAFSGTEAKLLLNIKEKAYTLVLLDLMLPGASGEEVLKEIRKHGRLPVIVLTAKDSIDDKIGVLTDGADDYITKPFEIREVLARIQVQLRHIEAEIKSEADAETEAEAETEVKTKAGIQKGQGSGRLEFRDMVLTRSTFEVIGELSDKLNELLDMRKKERNEYRKKEELIADTYTNLSHDIRTPLTSLDGYFQLIEECDNIDDQRRYLDIIRERLNSLNEMLEELFTFTKLKNDSYKLELTDCCMNRILKETVFSYYDEWKKQGICPEISITEEMLYISGNKQGLRRVIQNVIKNGLDHGEKNISIRLTREDNHALLKISNYTEHPENIDLSHVFERFYKADVARGRASTGLGLSIAKELVERMNGDISARIQGNDFIIEIKVMLVV